MQVSCTNYSNLKKEQTILIPAKYNHTCTKKNQSVAFQMIFCLNFKILLFKMKKKNDKFGLNCHEHIIQPLVFRILK